MEAVPRDRSESTTAAASPTASLARDFHGVYEAAPVSLWIEDYSGIRAMFDALRAAGVEDLAAHLAANPSFVDRAMAAIRVVDVNACTLALFRAPGKDAFLARLAEVFRDDMRVHFADELVQMWSGDLAHETEGVNYALDGSPIDILLRRCAIPGHETDWKRVLVSIVDISERKRAARALGESEAYARGLFEHSPVSLWVEDYTGIRRLFGELRARASPTSRATCARIPTSCRRASARFASSTSIGARSRCIAHRRRRRSTPGSTTSSGTRCPPISRRSSSTCGQAA